MKRIIQIMALVCCVLGLSWVLTPSALGLSWPDDIYMSDITPLPTASYQTNAIFMSDNGDIRYFYSPSGYYLTIYFGSGTSFTSISQMVNLSTTGYFQIVGLSSIGNNQTFHSTFNISTKKWSTPTQSQWVDLDKTKKWTLIYANGFRGGYTINSTAITGTQIPLVRITYETSNESLAQSLINEFGSFFPYYFWTGNLTEGTLYLGRDMRLDNVTGNNFTLSGTNIIALDYRATGENQISIQSSWYRPDFIVNGVVSVYTNARTLDVDGFIATGLIKVWNEYEDAFLSYGGSGELISLQDVLLAVERQTTQLKKAIDDGNDALAALIQDQTLVLIDYFNKLQKAINDGNALLAGLIQTQTNTMIDLFTKLQKALIDSKNELVAEIQKQTRELIEYFEELYNAQENKSSLEQVQEQLEEYRQMEEQAFTDAKTAYDSISPQLDLSFTSGNGALFLAGIMWVNIKLNSMFIAMGEWQIIIYVPLIVGLVLFSLSIGSRFFNAKGRK